MDVLVVGSNGAIGRRYCTLLRYIGINPIEIDIDSLMTIKMASEFTNLAINCTPSEYHYPINLELVKYGFKILCEKPACLDHKEIYSLKTLKANIREVNNWAYTIPSKTIRPNSHVITYNYFMCGKEMLSHNLWQPIILSKDQFVYESTSPVFRVFLDDYALSQRDFDMSYLYMIQDFVYDTDKAGWDLDTCKTSIDKVREWSLKNDNN